VSLVGVEAKVVASYDGVGEVEKDVRVRVEVVGLEVSLCWGVDSRYELSHHQVSNYSRSVNRRERTTGGCSVYCSRTV